MGIFEKKREDIVEEPSFDSKFNGTFIEEGVTFIGDFVTDDPIEIIGTVEGTIKSSQNVHVAKTGVQKGIMEVQNLYVDGIVDADVICKNTASFSTGAAFTGEVTTVNIEAGRGSSFKGKLNLVEPNEEVPPLIK